jgi:hypothetical protein
MKKLLLPLLAIFSFTAAQAQWGGHKIKGNGNMTTITRSTPNYNSVHCAGSFDYVLVAGNEGRITITGESNLVKHIITEVKRGQLTIKTENGKQLTPSRNKTITIKVPFEDIDEVSLSGSGDLWNEDIIRSTNFEAVLSGSGDIILNIQAHNAMGKISGSGDLTIKGSTENLKAGVTGSGDFHGFDLKSINTNVSVTGSGDADVLCNGKLTARVTGSGDISYKGRPTNEDFKIVGSGSIEN